jgi:hypothetical protein
MSFKKSSGYPSESYSIYEKLKLGQKASEDLLYPLQKYGK